MPKNTPKKIDAKLDLKSTPNPHWLNGFSKWLWLAVVVLVIFEALITNNQAANGSQLASLQDEQATLSTQVNQLEHQVTAAGSLQLIQQQASERLGLQPVDKNVMYLQLLPPIGASHD